MVLKLSVHKPAAFFLRSDKEISEKWNFLNDGYSQGNKRLFGKNWLQGIFDPVFVARSRVRATKCDRLEKI